MAMSDKELTEVAEAFASDEMLTRLNVRFRDHGRVAFIAGAEYMKARMDKEKAE